MNNFDQFEVLSETEIAAINGGVALDGLFTGLNSVLAGVGGALNGLGSVTAGAGSALALTGVGVNVLLTSTAQAVGAIGSGLAAAIGGIKLPTI